MTSFQTRSTFGDNRCDECLGLRFSPTEPIRHYPDCSQHPVNVYERNKRQLKTTWKPSQDVTVRVYCACGEAAEATGQCVYCAAEFWDPEHVEGSVDA